MKAFAASLLVAASAAADVSADPYNPHYTLNEHYDNHDTDHHHYGGPQPASPAYPSVPNFQQAVDHFDSYGTLFGEHRYQLQVAKTGNMLIGTEALRESIAQLKDRVNHAQIHVHDNDHAIEENDSDIEDNKVQIQQNRDKLHALGAAVHNIENGYAELQQKLAIDREALVMMCHQYAYAETLPHECVPIIGNLSQPIAHAWNWPQVPCPSDPLLPPFHYDLQVEEKVTTDDHDDAPAPNDHVHPVDYVDHHDGHY